MFHCGDWTTKLKYSEHEHEINKPRRKLDGYRQKYGKSRFH